MTLYELFERCLNINYLQTGKNANYATEIIGNSLYIYFEHSSGLFDWINNFNFPAIAYGSKDEKKWYAHRGFLSVFKSIVSLLEDLIMGNYTNIHVVGYSHGAALALLCYEYIWFNRPDFRGHIFGYGFGCPRVIYGNVDDELKRRWDSFYVIKNINDIVTRLPPRIFGFVHVGNIIEIGSYGKYSSIDAHRPENILKELNYLYKAY